MEIWTILTCGIEISLYFTNTIEGIACGGIRSIALTANGKRAYMGQDSDQQTSILDKA